MPQRDFFSFCTTLRPVELKALGELSSVRHLQKSEKIYEQGQESASIFSLNRGTIDLLRKAEGEPDEASGLARGDFFGYVDTLADVPRLHTATAREMVSVQCFEKEKFAQLAQRVPTFFLFLCKLMARRAHDTLADTAAEPGLQLSGDLASFDLVTVHQTLISSGQTGELTVLSDAGERLATFYFEEGSPRSGQFQHLTGEEAFWQLFLCEQIPGTFSFRSGQQATAASIQSAQIAMPPNDLLLSAMHYRDELASLKKSMPGAQSSLQRVTEKFAWSENADAHLRPLAERIWLLMGTHPMSIDDLYRHNAVCELRIYLAVAELLRSGDIVDKTEPPRFAVVS
ncbi:MAG: cyclic nucleotide-binding domain-containing protein [Verrucomicrobiota bacterium]|nr:cyclic nucleotide-binding domain-containing protein [Verrucomicrobiota bacterium]